MPPRYPKQDGRFLAWARNRTRVWSGWQPGGGSSGVPDIGLSEQQAQRAVELFEAAYDAHRRQIEAQRLAREATSAKRRAFDEFKDTLGADMATIFAYARTTGDPGVYPRAALRPRKKGAMRRPVAPSHPRLRFELANGAMVLTWKGRTLPGTIYRVERRIFPRDGADAPYEFVAGVAERRYADWDIPPGTTSVEYAVTATKNGRTSPGFTVAATLFGERWKQRAGAARAA